MSGYCLYYVGLTLGGQLGGGFNLGGRPTQGGGLQLGTGLPQGGGLNVGVGLQQGSGEL